jgi:Icc-related predicted phosphoesterase
VNRVKQAYLRFVAISDTHCRHRSLRLPKGDVLLHAGDISYRSSRQEIVDFLDWFRKQPFLHKVFIAGNHDYFFEREKQTVIQEMLPDSVYYLKDEALSIQGIKIWGSPYTPWFYRWAFNKQRGSAMAKHWNHIPPDTDILLTHGPVYGILDQVLNEQHAGDRDLLKKVIEIKPKVHVCGHIHEAYGTITRYNIKFINACILNESYELANKPVVFELSASANSLQPPHVPLQA